MLVQCYRSNDPAHREAIWRLIYNKGWMSDHITYMLFYIPSTHVDFALIIDPTLTACPHEDWYV
jgi:hypothetical protein